MKLFSKKNIKILLNCFLIIAVLITLITGVNIASAQTAGTWVPKANMPTQTNFDVSVINDTIYAVGYESESPDVTINTYNETSDTWSNVTRITDMTGEIASTATNGKIYIYGQVNDPYGSTYPVIAEFNPSSGEVNYHLSSQGTREKPTLVGLNGKVYVIGGKISSYPGHYYSCANLDEYNPVTNTWTARANMPVALADAGATVLDGKIYVMGGQESSYHIPKNTVLKYDPATNQWTTCANLPTARWNLGISSLNGKIYAFGGDDYSGNESIYNAVEEYSPSTNTWSKLADEYQGKFLSRAATVNGKIYVMNTWFESSGFTSLTKQFTPDF